MALLHLKTFHDDLIDHNDVDGTPIFSDDFIRLKHQGLLILEKDHYLPGNQTIQH